MTQQNAPAKCPTCWSDRKDWVNRNCAVSPDDWHRESAAPSFRVDETMFGNDILLSSGKSAVKLTNVAAPPEGETMAFTDRKHLYRIDDGNGDPLFVQAETFAEAVAKFSKWDGDTSETDYESIAYVGEIIDESQTRE